MHCSMEVFPAAVGMQINQYIYAQVEWMLGDSRLFIRAGTKKGSADQLISGPANTKMRAESLEWASP